MKAAWTDIRTYIVAYYQAAFHRTYFFSIIIMLSLIIFINYSFKIDFSASFSLTYALYCIPFAIAYLLQWFYFPRQRSGFKNKMFWFLLFTAPFIFASKLHFNLHQPLVSATVSIGKLQYSLAIINYVVKFLVVFIPVVLIWNHLDKKECLLYGFGSSSNYPIYYWMIVVMIPLVAAAASMPEFLKTYPKAFTSAGSEPMSNLPGLLLFELVYGLDFFTVEFFFRGFLIIAFVRYFGIHSILPAACFYCCIHLGKPMPEAISSFFGGLLLGIISYHTRSIWGGLIVHLGIAWLMEIAAYVAHQF